MDFYEVPLEALKKEESSLINEVKKYKEMLKDVAKKTDESFGAYGHEDLPFLRRWKLDEDVIKPRGTWQAINSEEKGWSFVCKNEDDNVIGAIELDLENKKLWFQKWDGANSEPYPHNMHEEDFSLEDFIGGKVDWFSEYELAELDRFQKLIIYESFGMNEKEIDKIFGDENERRAKNEYIFLKEEVSDLKDLKKELLKAIDRHKYDSERSYTNYLKTQGLRDTAGNSYYSKAYRFDGIDIGYHMPCSIEEFRWIVWKDTDVNEYRNYEEMMKDLKLPEGSPLKRIAKAIDYNWNMSKIAYNDFKIEKKLKNGLER